MHRALVVHSNTHFMYKNIYLLDLLERERERERERKRDRERESYIYI